MRLVDIDAAHAERRRLPQCFDREMFFPVPCKGVRRQMVIREGLRHVADGDLLFGQFERQAAHQDIVGMTNSAPSLLVEGQRAVTVLVLV